MFRKYFPTLANLLRPGFLRKLSGVSTEYMDGTGNWSTPAGGSTDHVVVSDGNVANPQPMNDGAGNFMYIPYVP